MSTPIEEFLVSLGFRVDETAFRKFQETIAANRKNITLLGAAIVAVGAATEIAVRKMASKFESLAWESQKTGAAVENIQALGFAFKQVGGDAGDALGALNAVSSLLRSSPGAAGWLASIGVQTQDAAGKARDMEEVVLDLSDALKRMKPYMAMAYANEMGIGQDQALKLMRLRREDLAEREGYRKRAGVDAKGYSEQAVRLERELNKTGMAAGVLWDKATGGLFKTRADFQAKVNAWLDANFEGISKLLDVVLQKLNAVMAWFTEGADAAGKGRFFQWFRGEWQSAFHWLDEKWKAHGGVIVDVLARVMTWLGDAWGVVAEDMADRLQTAFHNAMAALYSWLPDWARAGMGMMPDDPADVAKARREERAERLKALRQQFMEGVSGVIGSVGGALVPDAKAGEAPAPALSGNNHAEQAFRFFREKGLSIFGAAGIVGNLMGESYTRIDPNAVGDHGSARGIAQWHGARQQGMGTTFAQQLQHVWDEMTGQAPTRDLGAERALVALRAAQSYREAVAGFAHHFERAAAPDIGLRTRYATQAAAAGGVTITNNFNVEGSMDRNTVPDLERAINRSMSMVSRHMGGAVR